MLKSGHHKAHLSGINAAGQAATELAVFGAVLIFLIGTIVRSAVGNSYTQNQNFKAMRMAMLASWEGSKLGNTAHNNASVLFIEDRLAPDFNKYGDLDRNPFVAYGAGSFSYEMLYPVGSGEVGSNLPIMDDYINGQHFPFTTASYVVKRTLTRPSLSLCESYPAGSCEANQCYRNYREWANLGLAVKATQFEHIVPVSTFGSTTDTTLENNAILIFNELVKEGMINPATVTGTGLSSQGSVGDSTLSPGFISWLQSSFDFSAGLGFSSTTYGSLNPSTPTQQMVQRAQEAAVFEVQDILQTDTPYKLFYTMVANPGGGNTSANPKFSPAPPTCGNHPCLYKELSSDAPLSGYYGQPVTDGQGNSTNVSGDMEYDLLRMGYYASTPPSCAAPPCQSVEQQFGDPLTSCSDVSAGTSMRCNIAWQWAASGAAPLSAVNSTSGLAGAISAAFDEATYTNQQVQAAIGLDPSNNLYPNYDVDGRLKEVTIYGISQNSDGTPTVSYEDFQGGDIDTTWDANSCGPKPGLQGDSQIFTFTQSGTYLLINEGKLYNPETGQVVRSANKRDNIDLIQRVVQLSNNTNRFCNGGTPQPCVARCPFTPGNCTPSASNNYCNCTPSQMTCPATTSADYYTNPVEVCIPAGTGGSGGSGGIIGIQAPGRPTAFMSTSSTSSTDSSPTAGASGNNCFTPANISQTCLDQNDNMLFIRSRLEDRRGHFWMTNASGQLQVQ